jgi:hypothetical protein
VISEILLTAVLAVAPQSHSLTSDQPDVRPDSLGTKARITFTKRSIGRPFEAAAKVLVHAHERLPAHCYFDMSEPNYRCALQTFPDERPTNQDVKPGDILTAAREVGMPALKVHIQPGGRTLVNVDTIFYTDPRTLRRTVTLLGHAVRLEGRPVRYTWVHGDGTQASTSRPGRPYPAKDVTHQFQQPGDDLRARVDTSYRVRYSVDGGGWATLDDTLTARGPTSALDVDEAAPVLTH